MLLSELAPLVDAQQGVIYIVDEGDDGEAPRLRWLAGYAARAARPRCGSRSNFGEGLVGQCASRQARLILLTRTCPSRRQSAISSGLMRDRAEQRRSCCRCMFEDEVKAVIELASLREFSDRRSARSWTS